MHSLRLQNCSDRKTRTVQAEVRDICAGKSAPRHVVIALWAEQFLHDIPRCPTNLHCALPLYALPHHRASLRPPTIFFTSLLDHLAPELDHRSRLPTSHSPDPLLLAPTVFWFLPRQARRALFTMANSMSLLSDQTPKPLRVDPRHS